MTLRGHLMNYIYERTYERRAPHIDKRREICNVVVDMVISVVQNVIADTNIHIIGSFRVLMGRLIINVKSSERAAGATTIVVTGTAHWPDGVAAGSASYKCWRRHMLDLY